MIKSNEILIFGAGGHTSKLIEIFESDKIKIKGYISTEKPGSVIHNLTVIKNLEDYLSDHELHHYPIHIGIGENSLRHTIHKKTQKTNCRYVNCISNIAHISKNVQIGMGNAILPGSIIHTNSKIGSFCIIDSKAVIEHDTVIEDYVNISPGAILCGNVHIKQGAVIGAGCTIIEKVCVGENALVGAGSVVIKDVEPNSVVVGNPAHKIRNRTFNESYLN